MVAVPALGLLSVTAWRAEVEFVKGWAGLAWLRGYPWAALPICLFVGASALVAVSSKEHLPWPRAGIFVALVGSTSWVAFEIARRWFHDNRGWQALVGHGAPLSFWISSPLLSLVVTCVGIYGSGRLCGLAITPWAVPMLLGALVLVWPLSLVTIQVLPAHGYTDEIHAVKAGYPTFWVNLSIASALWAALRLPRRVITGRHRAPPGDP